MGLRPEFPVIGRYLQLDACCADKVKSSEKASRKNGKRILVDRLWPRGVSKEQAHLDAWMKQVAPSDSLRKWFGHDTEKWDEFRRRYYQELDAHPEQVQELRERFGGSTVTLLYGARDTEHNNAVALVEYLAARRNWRRR